MAEPTSSTAAPFTIRRTGITSGAPLSFAQEQLWLLEQLAPGSPAYNIPLVVDLDGPLDVGAITRAIAEVVRRHDALRTTFPSTRGTPYQAIQPADDFSVPVTDLAQGDAAERAAEAEAIVTAESRRPFDLVAGPVFRARLLRLAPDHHVLVACVHHIVYDAWSNGIVFREVATLYSAFSRGEASPLEELPVRFVDFAVAQREHLQGDVLARELAYWKEHLGTPPLLGLPTDWQRPAVESLNGGREYEFIPDDLIATLDRFSRLEGVTLFVTLLSAYAVLLHRLSSQDEVVIGTPISNRMKRDVEPVVGFFLNTLPLRIDLAGNPTFRDFVQRVKRVAFAAYAHQQLPFEKLVHELRPERTLGRTPLIDTVFVLDNNPGAVGDTVDVGNLRIRRRVIATDTAKFDIGLLLFRQDGGRRATVEYRSDLFDASTARRLGALYRRLLEVIRDMPEAPIGSLLQPTPEECATVIGPWSGRCESYPCDRTVAELFEAEARRSPDAVAVVDAVTTLTYQDLDRRASRLAHRLREAGVGPGALVGVCLERSAEAIVALLGILKAGAAYVPLDSSYPAERLDWMVERLGIAIVVKAAASGAVPPRACVAVSVDEGPAFADLTPDDGPPVPADAGALAYVLFTSGTTGDPKPVGVAHRAITRLAYGMPDVPLGRGSRVFHAAPLSFDASTFEIWGPLLRGGCVIVSPGTLPTPAELERLLVSHEVTVLWLTASLFNLIIDERPAALRSVRFLITGGEALSVRHVQRALAALPDTVLINGYGPTETTTFATSHVVTRHERMPSSIPIGRPLLNTRVYVLDDERRPVVPGLPGELWIGGDGVAAGYLGDPVLTGERFVPDPFVDPPARMYRSGDRVRFLPDGALDFLGRIDDQIKIRGFRIEPAEVEVALMAHADVERAAITVQDLPALGRTLVAYVVVRDSTQPPTSGALRAHLRSRLPDHLVPQVYEVVTALPLRPTGKIDREALKMLVPTRVERADDRVAESLSSTEAFVADIYRAVLGVAGVGRTSDFFELGGDSLRAARAIGRIRALAGVELSLRSLFEFPTVSALSKILEPYVNGPLPRVDPFVSFDEPELAVDAGLAREITRTAPAVNRLIAGEVESALAEVWRSVLGVNVVDVDDNFFELGGQSLMAVRLVAEIETRLGVSLAPATLFRHGTIREQSRLILTPHETVQWSPAVAIQARGTKPPLFLVHAIGGEVLSYEPLAARLGHERPIFGLRLRRENGRPVHATVEEMAASYVQAIRRLQPSGPYNIGGYSGGGLIAYDMARQLQSSGERVSLLAMIDCSAPGRLRPSLWSPAQWMRLPRLAAYWMIDDDFFRAGPRAAVGRVSSKIISWRQSRGVANGTAREVDVRHTLGLWRYPDSLRDSLAVLHKALRSYRPQPYAGSIAIIRARSRKLFAPVSTDPSLGWGQLVIGPVRTAVVAGAHDTILREPRVQQLATVLAGLLEEGDVGPVEAPRAGGVPVPWPSES